MCFICFNCCAPKSDNTCIRVPPANFTFINGLAYWFDESFYDDRLKGRINQNQFSNVISDINDKLGSHMPCPGLTMIGYLLAIPTLGLTWLMMWFCCVQEAQQEVRMTIDRLNVSLNTKKIHMDLHVSRGTSWLEFKLL